jgi:hypothetical protein
VANIIIKGIPDELRAQLEREAAANFRTLAQEVTARIQRTFDVDSRLNAPIVDRLIQESLDSGPEEALTRQRFDAARRKARAKFQARRKAA